MKDKLIKSAFDFIQKKGLLQLAMGELAKFANVGVGSFYHHFDSKEKLLETLFSIAIENLEKECSKISEPVGKPKLIFAELVDVFHTYFEKNSAQAQFVYQCMATENIPELQQNTEIKKIKSAIKIIDLCKKEKSIRNIESATILNYMLLQTIQYQLKFKKTLNKDQSKQMIWHALKERE